jgi:predicted permease
MLRRWRRNPLLTAHHIATIALGMAAVTAVVSLMLAMAFQPLPFRQSAQLIEVWNRVQSGAPVESLSGSELIEIQEQMGDMFTSLGGFTPLRLWLLDEQGRAEQVRIARLEQAAFRALDLTPVRGRSVAGSTASPDGLGPVWISHDLWQTRYGGRSSVIGETIRLAQNDSGRIETRSEIAGVLPPGIHIPQPVSSGPVDLWAILPDDFKVRVAKVNAFLALGRLRSDRTLAEVQAALTVLADRRPRPIDRRNRPVAHSLEEIAYGPARRTVGVMAVGVGLVLLLAFANLASLTVAEGSRRRLELSIRTSLGASRWRLWRDLVAEHAALTALALGVGLPLAWVTLRGLTRLVTVADIGPPLPQRPAVNLYVMLGFAASALAGTLAWAALIVRGVDAAASNGELGSRQLSRVTRPSTAERGAGLLRLGALSIQACLGIALMVLAISMASVYVRLTEVNLGPAPDRTVFFSVRPALGGAQTSAQAADFTSQVRSLVHSLPDVQALAFADNFPPHASAVSFWKQDDLAESPRDATYPLSVSHDYFNTLGIPILFGRGFEESDRYAGKAVAIIDLEMARRNWASPEEAVNAQIKVGSLTRGYEVIGVAGSFGGYWATVPIPTIYLSQNQDPRTANAVIVRADSSASSIAERVRQVLSRMPDRVEMSAPTTLQDGWQATATRPRARMVGMVLLALIGVGLGTQGVYALAASMVAARRQELAIRMALGATGPALVWLVLRQLIAAVVIGSGLGVLSIVTLQRLAPQWITAAVSDPAVSIALAVAVLLSTAVLGGLIPARSATREPSVAWPPNRRLLTRQRSATWS